MLASFRQVRCLVTCVDGGHGRIRYPVSGTAESETFFLLLSFFATVTRRRCQCLPTWLLVYSIRRRQRRQPHPVIALETFCLFGNHSVVGSEFEARMQIEPRAEEQVRSERAWDSLFSPCHITFIIIVRMRERDENQTRGNPREKKAKGKNPCCVPPRHSCQISVPGPPSRCVMSVFF